jgi:predicted ATPase
MIGVAVLAELFVDREQEFAVLKQLVDSACAGAGSVVVVEGQAGIGKSALMRRLIASGGPATYISVTCHAQVGQLQAYGPLLDVLLQIERNRPRRRRMFQLTGRTMKAAGPELLNLVPGLGPALKLVAETLTGLTPAAPTVDAAAAARAIAEALLQSLRETRPAVVIIDDVHRMDASSCAALSYMAQELTRHPIRHRCVGGSADVLSPRRVRGQIAWASSVNAAAIRRAGGASSPSS